MYFDLRSTKQSSKSRENSIRFEKSAQTLWQAPTVKCSAEQHGAVQFSEGLQLPLNGEESIRNSNRSINMDLAKLSGLFTNYVRWTALSTSIGKVTLHMGVP